MIRPVEPRDRAVYLQLAAEFYHSPAVLHPVPTAYLEATFEEITHASPYAEGFLLEQDGEAVGYALLSKGFSQEAGGAVVWVEELYIRETCRGQGLGSAFFRYLDEYLPPAVKRMRLEVEPDNARAAALYARHGFRPLPYAQMVKDR